MDFKIIAVDFDGTLCESKWPEIGEPNRRIIDYLKERQAAGDKLVLWTCRVGEILKNAVDWSAGHGLIFDAVNENLPEVLEWMGGDSRKIFADEYIDDRNVSFIGIMPDYENMKAELKAYKDTGLSPEQLLKIDHEYSVLAKEAALMRKERTND